jgi:hypothetical protein
MGWNAIDGEYQSDWRRLGERGNLEWLGSLNPHQGLLAHFMLSRLHTGFG